MTKLNYKVFGEGEPVVILHGLFGMLDNWQTFAKKLAENYMVYIVDQRDHGKSPHTNEFKYNLLAEDLKTFCEDQWIHQARFIGHSMGGRTCMHLALQYPDLVSQMVIVDMGVKTYTGGHQDIIDALLSVPIEKVKSRSEVDQLLAKTITDKGVRLFLMKNLSRSKEEGYRWKMNLQLLAREYANIMKGLDQNNWSDVDIQFIRGSRSQYIVSDDVDGIQSIFPKANIQTVDDAGHWIHAEQPQALLELISDYFGSLH